MKLKECVEKIIKKRAFPLKDGLELELILKARLTKKELKLLKELAKNCSNEEILKLQNSNEIFQKLIKKLNYEKVKDSLYKK